MRRSHGPAGFVAVQMRTWPARDVCSTSTYLPRAGYQSTATPTGVASGITDRASFHRRVHPAGVSQRYRLGSAQGRLAPAFAPTLTRATKTLPSSQAPKDAR